MSSFDDYEGVFGRDLQIGRFLKIGLSENSEREEIENLNFDDLRSAVVEANRNTVKEQLVQIREQLKVVPEKEKKDSHFDRPHD